jgi:hypothetical protein
LVGSFGVHGLAAAVDVADGALRVNHKRSSFGDTEKTQHAVLAGDLLFRITQQREREAQLLRKVAVGLRPVDADAQNLSAGAFKNGKTILVCLELLRSARRVGVNIECQDDTALPPEIAEPDEPPIVVQQHKIRRRVSDAQYHPGPPWRIARPANRGMAPSAKLLLLLLRLPVRHQAAGIVGPGRVQRFPVLVNVRDDALLVHHKGGPVGEPALGVQDSIFLGNRPIEIAEQRERYADLLGERPVGRRTVHADAQHLCLRLLELGEIRLIRL